MKQLWLVVAATLGMVSSAAACSCAQPPLTLRTVSGWDEWYIQRVPVIFQGKVESVRLENLPVKPVPGKYISKLPRIQASFSEVKFYRGESSASVTIQTGVGAGDCGYPFEPGHSYLVFAYKDDSGALESNICTGTRRLENASEMLRVVRGAPAVPEDPQKQTIARESTGKLCGRVKLRGEQDNAHADCSATVYLWLADEVAPEFRAQEAETEPDGSFCFNDVDPGKYILAAMTDSKNGVRYMGYYPGVTERSQARTITASEDGHSVAADLPLPRQKLYTVTGYLRGVPETLNNSISVILMPATLNQLNLLNPVQLEPHGRFEVSDVPPGHYLVYATSFDNDQERTLFVSAGLDLDVSGDMENIRLDYVGGK